MSAFEIVHQDRLTGKLTCFDVRGHVKVPTGGQVEVPTGGHVKVPTGGRVAVPASR